MLLAEHMISRSQAGVCRENNEEHTPPHQKWYLEPNAPLRQYGTVHLLEMTSDSHVHVLKVRGATVESSAMSVCVS